METWVIERLNMTFNHYKFIFVYFIYSFIYIERKLHRPQLNFSHESLQLYIIML